MSETKTSENTVNEAGTSGRTDAAVTRGRSGPVPCFLAIDKRGKIRGRYRFAHLAVLEVSERGWELRMEGYE